MTSDNFTQPCQIGVFLRVSSFLELLFQTEKKFGLCQRTQDLVLLTRTCRGSALQMKRKAAGFWRSVNFLHFGNSARECAGMLEEGGHILHATAKAPACPNEDRRSNIPQ